LPKATARNKMTSGWKHAYGLPILQYGFVSIPVECYQNIDSFYYHDYLLQSLHSLF